MVTCNVCEKKYNPVFRNSTDQGYECASVVKNGVLAGHYGSEVADMITFEIKTQDLKEGHVICDTCITSMIKDELLVEIPEEPVVNCGSQDIEELFGGAFAAAEAKADSRD